MAYAPPWHIGLELRPGYAVRPLRLGGGVGIGQFEVHLVADPLAFVDGIHDLDVSGSYWFGESGYSLWAGWRPTAVVLDESITWQQSALAGALARLPTLGLAAFRALVGLEFSVLVLQHGGGIPAEANCFCDGVSVSESLGFAIFLRIEYAPLH